jgi:hypothetical protein
MCDDAMHGGGQTPHLQLTMRSLIVFAVRWVVLGTSAWVMCLVLFALFHPAAGLAVMLGCGLGYIADVRRLTRRACRGGGDPR